MPRNILPLATRWLLLMLAATLTLSVAPGCKSKKKLQAEQTARAEAERQVRIDRARATLLTLLNDDTMPLAEKERQLAYIKQQNLGDPEINDLIRQVEQKLLLERAKLEEERRKQEMAEGQAEAQATAADRVPRLQMSLQQLATTRDYTTANQRINTLLEQFASGNVPVLIKIYQQAGIVDYDEPTSIEEYLHYLKYQQRMPDRVESVEVNAQGKITKLVLRKLG